MRRHPRVAQIKLEDDRHADLRQRKDIAGACTRRDISLKLAQKGGKVFLKSQRLALQLVNKVAHPLRQNHDRQVGIADSGGVRSVQATVSAQHEPRDAGEPKETSNRPRGNAQHVGGT